MFDIAIAGYLEIFKNVILYFVMLPTGIIFLGYVFYIIVEVVKEAIKK